MWPISVASQFYSNWRFVPAYNNGTAPYGTWTAKSATVLTSYFNGSDSCAQRGVVCQNDVAVITLNPQSGAYPGTKTGYLGYGWNGYSYNSSGQVLISQLGYPVALDNGALMERTDSQGFTSASQLQQHGHWLVADRWLERRTMGRQSRHRPGAQRYLLRHRRQPQHRGRCDQLGLCQHRDQGAGCLAVHDRQHHRSGQCRLQLDPGCL